MSEVNIIDSHIYSTGGFDFYFDLSFFKDIITLLKILNCCCIQNCSSTVCLAKTDQLLIQSWEFFSECLSDGLGSTCFIKDIDFVNLINKLIDDIQIDV